MEVANYIPNGILAPDPNLPPDPELYFSEEEQLDYANELLNTLPHDQFYSDEALWLKYCTGLQWLGGLYTIPFNYDPDDQT